MIVSKDELTKNINIIIIHAHSRQGRRQQTLRSDKSRRQPISILIGAVLYASYGK